MNKFTGLPKLTSIFGKDWVGFDRVFDEISNRLDNGINQLKTYPPYNISKYKNEYFIELALAGFKKDEILVELKNNILTIKTKDATFTNANTLESGEFIHQGLAKRAFTSEFKLNTSIKVNKVQMQDGILKIHLIDETKEPEVTTINIE